MEQLPNNEVGSAEEVIDFPLTGNPDTTRAEYVKNLPGEEGIVSEVPLRPLPSGTVIDTFSGRIIN